MNYNLTFLDTGVNLLDLTVGVNDMTGGVWLVLFLVILYVSLLLAFKNLEVISSYILTSFLVSIIASLLMFTGLLHWFIVVIPIALLIVSIILKFFN